MYRDNPVWCAHPGCNLDEQIRKEHTGYDTRSEKIGSGAFSEKALEPCSSGHAYLADRRKHYAVLDAAETEADATAVELRQALAGHCVKAAVERPRGSGAPLLSLHFLVQRERVPFFREAFQAAERDRPERMLLTGPWPPYNFVEGA